MKTIVYLMVTVCFLFVSVNAGYSQGAVSGAKIKLPEPKYDGNVSVEKALKERRSVRFTKTPL